MVGVVQNMRDIDKVILNELVMSDLDSAILLAVKAHIGQVDQAGEPYILHPLRVMLTAQAWGMSVDEQIAAVLHDVVEDTDIPIESIHIEFGIEVSRLVSALTREKGQDYEAYLSQVIRAGPSARRIKRIDLLDNLTRIDALYEHDEAAASRLETKYHRGLALLLAYRDG